MGKRLALPQSKQKKAAGRALPPGARTGRLLDDIRSMIEAARTQAAQAVNAGLVTLYWRVGRRIRQDVIGEGRAAYGEQIVYALSTQLTADNCPGPTSARSSTSTTHE